MTQYLIQETNQILNGLGTLTFTVPTTGVYNVKCQSTFQPGSSLAILVKNNGATKYTAPAPTPTQTALQFQTDLLLTAADSVTVVLSSAAAVDNTLNAIQSNISIGSGE